MGPGRVAARTGPCAPRRDMEETKRSTPGIVRFTRLVKDWVAHLPSVEEARPTHCPWCHAASRPVGGRRVLHGHGTRARQVRGPREPGGEPVVEELQVRRYQCQACGATCTVAPLELVTRRLYSLGAIVWALALWGLMGLSSARVRALVNPFKHAGAGSAPTWYTLVRWVQAVQRNSSPCPVTAGLTQAFKYAGAKTGAPPVRRA